MNFGKIKIGNTKIGDKLLTHKGFKSITHIFSKIIQPVYKIKTKSGKDDIRL